MANPNESKQQAISGLTKEDLIAILEAVRKPVKSDKELRDEKQLELDREAMAATLKDAAARRLQDQKDCRHMRRDGSTQTVFIADLGRLYCQACQKWICAVPVLDEKGNVVIAAEPEMFNTHYQLVY